MSHGAHIRSSRSEVVWRVSSYSGGQGNCLEVADNLPHGVHVRDSKRPAGPVIVFSHSSWDAFVADLHHDKPFNSPSDNTRR
ncbi:DUF397 domain-containing protein [Streptomyces sp. 2MCAF27]